MSPKVIALFVYVAFQVIGIVLLARAAYRMYREAKAETKPGCRCVCHKHESQGGWRSTRCCPDCGRSLTGNVV